MKNKLLSILHDGQSKKYGISILFLIFLTSNTALGATYYIDSVAGLDSNNGTAIATPWKSVTKVNSKTLVAGDKIYLKCGSVWNGEQLKFSGSGSATNPIIVDQYGTGAKPILNGNGLTTTDQGVVYLYNQQYIEINNLEITNYPTLLVYANSTAYAVNQIVYNGIYAYQVTVAGTTPALGGSPTHTSGNVVSGSVTFSYYCNLTNLSYPDNMFFTGISDGTLTNNPLGADRRGVMVALKNKGSGTTAVANHIYLKNLYIHHIKGQLGNGSTTINGAIPKRTGGIYFTVLGETSTSNSRFNDVLIDGCTISYSENVGLAFDNEDNVYYPGGNEYSTWYARRFSNVKVSNNTIHHIGKNAMIIRCTDETGLIEHNTCYETALGTTGNTMFSARAKGTVFQYNEGYYNRATTQTVDPGTIDGSMYDPDYGSVGIIFQYSYSHDNSEGIYWGCNTRSLSNNTSGIPDPEDVGCTLRYNISQNDKGDLIFLNYSSAGNEIYNNIFYIKSGLSPNIIHENSGNNHTYNFYNNIIYNLGSGGYAFGSGTGIQTRTIQNNTFYGTHASDEPSDIYKLTSNPLFVSPGAGTIGINSLLEGYKLQSGSPALSSGKLIATNGGFDFYGNSVSSSTIPNRGAYQGAAIVSVTPPPTANNQNFCASLNPSVANLVATGTLLKWYANEIGGIAIATSTILVTATYYVSQTISGVESSRTAVFVTVNATDSPLASAQLFCNSGTVADLVATGTNLQWYSDATVGSALATTIILSSGTYYASQTLNGCESVRASLLVTVNITSAPSESTQTFCNSGTIANLVATGTNLQWYSAATGGDALATTTALASRTYYVSQTLNGCESARTSVLVAVNTTSTPSASAQIFCNSGTVANLVAMGTNLQWYSAVTSGSALATTTILSSGTYYVSQTLNSCESARTSVAVTKNSTAPPIASAQSFCILSSPTIATLAATGESLKWYSVLTGGTSLETNTTLTAGTYYVSQTLNGCESTRHSVAITITNGYSYFVDADGDGYGSTTAVQFCDATAPAGYSTNNTDCDDNLIYSASEVVNGIDDNCNGLIDEGTTLPAPVVTNTSMCKGATGVILTATALPGYTLLWYAAATGNSAPLTTAPVITATKTYYVAQRLGTGSISPRAAVTVTVNPLPTTPSKLELTSGSEVIKKVGNFIGIKTELTLTATPAAGTVATNHYNWALPNDVNQTGGDSNAVITIDFNDVQKGNTAIDLLVSSVSAEGCVSKTAKKLTVTRSVAGTPKGLTIKDAELPSVLKITKLDAYTGVLKERALTLTATANTTAGSQASSYKWVLPETVKVISSTLSSNLQLDGMGTRTVTTTSNVLEVNLANVTTETSFLFKVYGVNGNGQSATSKDLTCTSAAPKTPSIVANSSTTFNTCSTRTYTATDILGATYNWTVPSGASIVGSSAGNVIEVSFSGVTTAAIYAVTCSASNGTGTSAVKSLTIKRAATCARIAPEAATTTEKFSVVAYPNPSNDQGFRVKSGNGKSFRIQVYDILGRAIEQRQITSDAQIGSHYARGVYNVIVTQGANVKTLQVIKQ